jgi:hydrogenase maturation protease
MARETLDLIEGMPARTPARRTALDKALGGVGPVRTPSGRRATGATLLLGMGNPILTDDAIGIRLAREFKRRLADQADVTVVEECGVGGLNLLDLVAGHARLVVIDSIRTDDGVPATWYRFDGRSLHETMNMTNVHDANFATALELGRQMGMVVPEEADCHIFAVEIADNITFSEEMTPDLEAAFPELADEIYAEVEALLT